MFEQEGLRLRIRNLISVRLAKT